VADVLSDEFRVMSDESKPTRGVGWAFLFTLRRESAPFLRLLHYLHPFPDGPCPAAIYDTNQGRAIVMETGIGMVRAAAAIRWLLDNYQPRLIIACGFAGALSPELRVGDVLLASGVVEPGVGDVHWGTAMPTELGDLPVGRLVTAKRLVATTADKGSMYSQTQAIMVDMESAAIAEACQKRGVQCAIIRSISDTADTALSPQLVALLSGGRIAPWRIVAALARSPGMIVELWRLARDTRIAARALAAALGRLVD
jgi:hypothetical protein